MDTLNGTPSSVCAILDWFTFGLSINTTFTLLSAIALRACKETKKQIMNLPLELSIRSLIC